MTHTAETRIPAPVMTALAAATLTASLGISIASVLLPTLACEFSATVPQVQWVVLAYLLSVTVAIVPAGQLGDLFGHRRVLITGLALFIAASVTCAAAPGLGLLVAGRAVQGLGGAVLIALPMSIARDLVPARRLGRAMGLLGTTTAAGTALGPSLGGMLIAWGDWRMAFWLLSAVAGLALVLALAALAAGPARKEAPATDLDLPGMLTLAVALLAYALATGGGRTAIGLSAGALLAGALIAVVLFVMVETRAAAPLVPMGLLRDRSTAARLAMNLLVGTVMMSTLVVGPFFLTFALGLNAARVGIVMAVGPVVAALSGLPAGWLTDRIGTRRVMWLGLGQITVGLLCLAVLPRLFGVGGYVAALVALTPAFQMFLAANNTAILADAPPEQRGRLSGLLGLSRNLGLMTGASAMPALFVLILGSGDAAQAPAADVARAFSATFVAAAGLAFVTLGLAIWGQAGRGRLTPSPRWS